MFTIEAVKGFTGNLNEAQFSCGLGEGVTGVCTIDYVWSTGPHQSKDNYFVCDNIVRIMSHYPWGISERSYICKNDYLFKQENDWVGNLPNANIFCAVLKRYVQGNPEPLIITFLDDGTYNEYIECASGGRDFRSGIYRRNGDLIVRQEGGKYALPKLMIVDDDVVHDAEFVFKEKAEKALQLRDEMYCWQKDLLDQKSAEADMNLLTMVAQKTVEMNKLNRSENKVSCPYCNSTRVKKIGALNRFASLGFFGIASSKIGKQWTCQSCGTNF